MENKYNDIERLLELKNKGTITEEEFEQEKKAILNSNSNTSYQESRQTERPKKKIKVWQIILLIISILLVRFCCNCYWNGSYRKLQD